jgi:hypothetical protein
MEHMCFLSMLMILIHLKKHIYKGRNANFVLDTTKEVGLDDF